MRSLQQVRDLISPIGHISGTSQSEAPSISSGIEKKMPDCHPHNGTPSQEIRSTGRSIPRRAAAPPHTAGDRRGRSPKTALRRPTSPPSNWCPLRTPSAEHALVLPCGAALSGTARARCCAQMPFAFAPARQRSLSAMSDRRRTSGGAACPRGPRRPSPGYRRCASRRHASGRPEGAGSHKVRRWGICIGRLPCRLDEFRTSLELRPHHTMC